jgi:hypothetical protein
VSTLLRLIDRRTWPAAGVIFVAVATITALRGRASRHCRSECAMILCQQANVAWGEVQTGLPKGRAAVRRLPGPERFRSGPTEPGQGIGTGLNILPCTAHEGAIFILTWA